MGGGQEGEEIRGETYTTFPVVINAEIDSIADTAAETTAGYGLGRGE